MRRRPIPNDTERPLRVVISAEAWKQLGLVPAGVFRRITEEMEAFASGMLDGVLARSERSVARFPFYFPIGEFAALCDVDPVERTLTLQEVARRLPRDS